MLTHFIIFAVNYFYRSSGDCHVHCSPHSALGEDSTIPVLRRNGHVTVTELYVASALESLTTRGALVAAW